MWHHMDLLTTDEVAGMLRASVQTVRYWRKVGTGPQAVKLGKRVLYRRADVEAWLDEQYAKAGR